jgi:hypothetical protein
MTINISEWLLIIYWSDDVDTTCFVLDQHGELDFYSASSLKKQSTDKTFRSTLTHYHTPLTYYHNSKSIGLFSYYLMISA